MTLKMRSRMRTFLIIACIMMLEGIPVHAGSHDQCLGKCEKHVNYYCNNSEECVPCLSPDDGTKCEEFFRSLSFSTTPSTPNLTTQVRAHHENGTVLLDDDDKSTSSFSESKDGHQLNGASEVKGSTNLSGSTDNTGKKTTVVTSIIVLLGMFTITGSMVTVLVRRRRRRHRGPTSTKMASGDGGVSQNLVIQSNGLAGEPNGTAQANEEIV